MFSFLSGISWTYYLIAALIIALLASGYLLKNSIAETGALSTQNDALTRQLATANKDKENLGATLASTAQKSLEDSKEREVLQGKVSVLNKKINTLTRLTKDKGTSDVKTNNASSDDIYLSDQLRSVLSESYCQSVPGLCPAADQPVK